MDELVFGRRYRVTEKIGSGGMADVYKAVDEVLGRTVAVKVLHERYASDPGFVARFRQEAQAAANLSNPGIVNIFDWGRDDETYYIVMEYVHGTDLKAYVAEHGPVDSARAAEFGSQVCAALAVAHGYDVIHRDIKPHNIVLTPDGQIKVMDFGIARMGNTQLTQTGSVLGTAHYVSPEQAQGRPLDARSDLYSLGVVLYELTTGSLPFEGDSAVSVALKQVNEDPTPPREVDPNVSPAMEAVILRAMAKSPADRYSSADEMRRDLQRVASGRVVEAVAPLDETSVMPVVGASSDRVRPVPAKRKVWPWIVAVAALVLIGLTAAWAFGLFDGPGEVVVPDVIGLSEDDARAALESVELTVGPITSEFAEEPAGTVVGQDPESGNKVEPGAAVALVVSEGLEMAAVPDLTGLAEAEAITAVRDAGFELDTIQREYNSDIAEGDVISQTPAPATQAPVGSRITLVVSRGTELVQVPDVESKSRNAAISAIEGAGLSAKVTEEYNDTVERGIVISQSPAGGVSVEIGSTVNLVVSLGPDLVPVPDVIGDLEADARSRLEGDGFVVSVQDQVSPDDGVVLTSDPVPGTSAKRGSTVTIWVGRTP